MPPDGRTAEYRFSRIEVTGFGARPRGVSAPPGPLMSGAGERSSAAGRKRGGIGRNRRQSDASMASQAFTTCVGGSTSAQNGGDMQGWFHLISATRAGTNPPKCRAFTKKRLMGFEPTTFCMAIRRVPKT